MWFPCACCVSLDIQLARCPLLPSAGYRLGLGISAGSGVGRQGASAVRNMAATLAVGKEPSWLDRSWVKEVETPHESFLASFRGMHAWRAQQVLRDGVRG